MIYRPDLYNLQIRKTAGQVTKNWNWLFLISQLLKISNINTGHKSKMVWNKRHKLQTKIVQFKDQKKVWIGTNEIFWTSLKSKAQFKQFTDQQKVTKKWLDQFRDQMKTN